MTTAAARPAEKRLQLQVADPCAFVIFGATGDLTKRKLLPALYHLGDNKVLPKDFCLIGTGQDNRSHEDYRKELVEDFKTFVTDHPDESLIKWFTERTYFLQADFGDASAYRRLAELLALLDGNYNTGGNHLYYLATPPSWFGPIAEQLGKARLAEENERSWRRIAVEKPFGTDLQSARKLQEELLSAFTEKQIFRIDHYLGKETVQNIIVFRFADGLFEPVWNRHNVDHVQITVAETVGVEGRGGYYDKAGALRDMVQNHLFQVMSLIAMEAPARYEAELVRDAKRQVFEAVRRLDKENLLQNSVRAQYTHGMLDDKPVPGYREEESVDPNSLTETYLALKLHIDNERWQGVPFYLRTGKRLPEKRSEVVVNFKRQILTQFDPSATEQLNHNRLILRIQPDEGITLKFGAKIPGPLMRIGMAAMNFDYETYFRIKGAGGYQTLLYDILIGDHMLFTRADTVEESWSVLDPLLEAWSSLPPSTLYSYPAGSWGPKEADALIEQDNRCWHLSSCNGNKKS
jgi:glucose-6-phosphate 1-dehydrogenase